ncbi:MAG: flagellar hook-associated protein FlgK [Gammaproteobacteria bacterium]|nr:flagellar hook-associated protein FlgK [Gammaproteobacteria bacterium]
MGVDLLQLGISGLSTAQQQLSTTGHNIANVNNDGYSRQRVIQETTTPFNSGSDFLGTGSKIKDVQRVFDQFRYNEVVFNQSTNSGAQTSASKLGRLDETMSLVGPNITNSLNDLFAAVNSLVDVPGDVGLRQVMLAKADTLAVSTQSMQRTLEAEYSSVNEDIESSVERMTAIAEQLARVNRDVVTASAGGATPNDLLDERDNLLIELAEFTKVSTVATQDGALNVYIANGQTLVTGTSSFSVTSVAGSPDPKQLQVVIQSPSSALQHIDGKNMGGSVGALISYRDGALTETLNKVGLTAIAIADTFNTAQSQGVDLNGLTGQNLFEDINDPNAVRLRSLGATSNTGTLAGGVEITNVNQLSGDDFRLQYSGGTYTLTNLSSGQSQAMTLVVETPAPAVGARSFEATSPDTGFIFKEAGGIPLDGDKFELQPTRLGASNLEVNLTSADQIAASSIVEIYPSGDNVNTAKLTISSVDNSSAADFPTTAGGLSLQAYESPVGTFNLAMVDSSGTAVPLTDLSGAALTSYSGGSIEFQAAGITFKLTGDPTGQTANAPEVYDIDYAFGSGNSKNMLAMAQLTDQKLMNNGKSTIADVFEEAVTNVGSQSATANIEAGAAQTLYDQATARMSNTSGVNLDEEASNLLRFQQAYSASAQVISTANEIFQTILQAVR